jgi:protein TonB
MAGNCFRDEVRFAVAVARGLAAGRTRLAAALAVSLFLHTWLAAGIAVDVPGRSSLPAALPLTALLQPLAVASESETHPAENVALPEPDTARAPPSRTRVKPPAGDESGAEADNHHSSAAHASLKPDEAEGLALQPVPSTDPYYAAPDLDVYPALRGPLKLEHPERTARAVSGRALVMLALNEAGLVDEVSVVKSEPRGYFEEAVRGTLGLARFFPAQKNGRAVKSRILVTVEFDRDASAGVVR